MDDIFGALKKGAVRAKDEAEKITKTVVKKSSDLVGQTKLGFALNETEDKLKSVFGEIGKYVYEQYKDGAEFIDFVGEKCVQLDELSKEIEELKKRIAEIKSAVICSKCGKYNDSEDMFCSKCGEQLKD